jgi:hypothetical protein
MLYRLGAPLKCHADSKSPLFLHTYLYSYTMCSLSLSLKNNKQKTRCAFNIVILTKSKTFPSKKINIPFFCVEATIDFQQQKSEFIYERFIETTTTYILNKQIILCFSLFIAFCFFMEKKHTKKHVWNFRLKCMKTTPIVSFICLYIYIYIYISYSNCFNCR